jgi:dsRNA-specific ribonuclease
MMQIDSAIEANMTLLYTTTIIRKFENDTINYQKVEQNNRLSSWCLDHYEPKSQYKIVNKNTK